MGRLSEMGAGAGAGVLAFLAGPASSLREAFSGAGAGAAAGVAEGVAVTGVVA